METKKIIQPVKIDYQCDDCEDGVMRHNGMVLTSNPAQYPHNCTKCGSHKTFRKTYPYISYEEVIEKPETKEDTTLKCTKCNEGQMIATGEYQATHVPRYLHKCSNVNCDNSVIVHGKKYEH